MVQGACRCFLEVSLPASVRLTGNSRKFYYFGRLVALPSTKFEDDPWFIVIIGLRKVAGRLELSCMAVVTVVRFVPTSGVPAAR